MLRQLTMTLTTLAALAAAPVLAQAPPAGECTGNSGDPACGAPEQSGGGCGCGGGSILIAFTDQGDSFQYADDFDDDGFEDNADNAPFDFNPDQIDTDGDGFGDVADFCPSISARLQDGLRIQLDIDADGLGDECDNDMDEDGFANDGDNCPSVINPFLSLGGLQLDIDADNIGDACDTDDDNDGCLDAEDNCPLVSAANCRDTLAVVPNECFPDADADGIEDAFDLCPTVVDSNQQDTDGDTIGNACDADLDNDGIDNNRDNCKQVPNVDQVNEDRDGKGDACDDLRCFVIAGDEANCLDPTRPFAVKGLALAPRLENGVREAFLTGKAADLQIFANRENKAIRYTWIIKKQPAGGDAVITNPKGAVSYSESTQYFHESDRSPKFTARTPGQYVLELQAELAFADDEGYDVRADISEVIIDVGGEAEGGCASVPASTPALFALAGLVFAARRRRRQA